jgi:hypothetical protein
MNCPHCGVELEKPRGKPRSVPQHRKTCEQCGIQFCRPSNVHWVAWSRRKYCNATCRSAANLRHGEAWRTPEYYVWQAMIQRCTNKKNPNYRKYGSRGITVCDRWRNSFQNFLDDMGRRDTPHHSIERIDNDGGYNPSNCKWATTSQQANNTRWNKRITVDGTTRTISEWSKENSIAQNTIVTRLRLGWSEHRAVTEKVNLKCRTKRAKTHHVKSADT